MISRFVARGVYSGPFGTESLTAPERERITEAHHDAAMMADMMREKIEDFDLRRFGVAVATIFFDERFAGTE